MRRDVPPYPGLTRLTLKNLIDAFGWEVGDHTYGSPTVREQGAGPLRIGRFTSMATVTIILGNHAASLGSTYPFDALRSWWPGMTDASCHTGRGVTIGSDVWLAEGAMVLPGADVGHGAIVGAGAVVRGPVPPYAIVVGNPGQILKYRFDAPTVARLLATAWWDRTDEEINDLLPLLTSPNVQALLARLETALQPA